MTRGHDVSQLTTAELKRARRDLRASLALARPGSAASVPISAHLSAIDTELAARSAGYGPDGKPSSPNTGASPGTSDPGSPLPEPW